MTELRELQRQAEQFEKHGPDVHDEELAHAPGEPQPPPERFPRPTGEEVFNSMTREQQDAEFGPEKAEALRKGTITLADLVAESPTEADAQNFITEKSLANAKKE